MKPIEISPLFLGQPTPEYSDFIPRSDDFLENLFANMKRDGFKMVLPIGGWGETAAYPSKVLKNSTKTDWYAKAFDLAEEYDMQVVLPGVSYKFNNLFINGEKWEPREELDMLKQVFVELNERYGDRKNLWGWYIPQEAGDRTHRGDIMVILREIPRFLKKITPDKFVAYSPWFTSKITLGDEATTPEECAANWDSMLDEIDGIDVYAFQDTTAPDDEIEKWFAAVAPVFEKHGAELWDVVELFIRFQDKPGIDLFRSVDFDYLMEKMRAASPYVKNFACWEYETHLFPEAKTPGANILNKKYRKWLTSTQ